MMGNIQRPVPFGGRAAVSLICVCRIILIVCIGVGAYVSYGRFISVLLGSPSLGAAGIVFRAGVGDLGISFAVDQAFDLVNNGVAGAGLGGGCVIGVIRMSLASLGPFDAHLRLFGTGDGSFLPFSAHTSTA